VLAERACRSTPRPGNGRLTGCTGGRQRPTPASPHTRSKGQRSPQRGRSCGAVHGVGVQGVGSLASVWVLAVHQRWVPECGPGGRRSIDPANQCWNFAGFGSFTPLPGTRYRPRGRYFPECDTVSRSRPSTIYCCTHGRKRPPSDRPHLRSHRVTACFADAHFSCSGRHGTTL
jgi:hypothetical protein